MTNRLDVDIATARHFLEDPALDRIIAAPRGHHQPERDALRVDILRCCGIYGIAAGPGTVGFNKRQADRLNSIRKHAKKIARLLKEDDADLRIIPRIWPMQLLPLMVEVLEALPGLRGSPPRHGRMDQNTPRHNQQRLAIPHRHVAKGGLRKTFRERSEAGPRFSQRP